MFSETKTFDWQIKIAWFFSQQNVSRLRNFFFDLNNIKSWISILKNLTSIHWKFITFCFLFSISKIHYQWNCVFCDDNNTKFREWHLINNFYNDIFVCCNSKLINFFVIFDFRFFSRFFLIEKNWISMSA